MKKPTVPGTRPKRSLRQILLAVLPALLFSLAAGTIIGGSTLEAATKKPATTQKKTPARTSANRTPVRKTSTVRKSAPTKRTTASRRARSSKRRMSASQTRLRQQSPTADRYREIQQALQSAGFLEGEPSGRWDDSSITAMKRFQEQHSLPATGKINALSLIALGLGPKRGPAPGTASVLDSSPSDMATESNQRE